MKLTSSTKVDNFMIASFNKAPAKKHIIPKETVSSIQYLVNYTILNVIKDQTMCFIIHIIKLIIQLYDQNPVTTNLYGWHEYDAIWCRCTPVMPCLTQMKLSRLLTLTPD